MDTRLLGIWEETTSHKEGVIKQLVDEMDISGQSLF